MSRDPELHFMLKALGPVHFLRRQKLEAVKLEQRGSEGSILARLGHLKREEEEGDRESHQLIQEHGFREFGYSIFTCLLVRTIPW